MPYRNKNLSDLQISIDSLFKEMTFRNENHSKMTRWNIDLSPVYLVIV